MGKLVGCITLICNLQAHSWLGLNILLDFKHFNQVTESTDICQVADIVGYEFCVFLSLSWQSGGRSLGSKIGTRSVRQYSGSRGSGNFCD